MSSILIIFVLMSQKVSPIIFRIGNRRSWLSAWNVKKQKYALTLFNDLQLRFYFDFLLRFFCLFSSNPSISKNASGFHLYSKIISSQNLLTEKQAFSAKRKELLKRKKENLNLCFLFSRQLFLSVFSYKKSFSRQKLFNGQTTTFSNSLYFPFLSAQVLCNFISFKLKEEALFKRNIRKGILQIAQSCFNKKTIDTVAGIKITCSGRWSKSASGRTQSFTYSLGRIETQSFYSFLDHGTSNLTTSFGSCCLNVWLCFKYFR